MKDKKLVDKYPIKPLDLSMGLFHTSYFSLQMTIALKVPEAEQGEQL